MTGRAEEPLTAERTTLGFVGLGVMGRPMAQRLLQVGYSLRVYNRSREPVEALAAEGAVPTGSAAEAVEGAQAVITMLPDAGVVQEVVWGADGIGAGLRGGAVLIDMSTGSPIATQELAAELSQRDVAMLDAPVSGGEEGAKAGTLAIMVGGDEGVFERCRPVFASLGEQVLHLGPVGAGQVTKACNQIVIGLTIQAIAEALEMARRMGVEPAAVRSALLGGAGRSEILERKGPRMLADDFAPGFKARLHYKDLGIALEAGRAVGVPLLATALVTELFGALVSRGQGELDNTALALLVRDLAGNEGATDDP